MRMPDWLDQSDIFYFVNPDIDGVLYSVIDGKIDYSKNKLDQLKQYALVVADYSTEHWGPGTEIIDTSYRLLKESGINFVIFVHDPADHQRYPEVFFYPFWYYTAKRYFVFAKQVPTSKKQYLVGCFNGTPRTHRIINYLEMSKKSYMDQNLFTFFNPENRPVANEGIVLDQEQQAQWDAIKKNFPKRHPGPGFNIDHPICTNSYIHLVTETNVASKIFVSEKTWKAIAAEQLFLVLGNPGTINYLRGQGVDCFDDIIDHKYYDNEPDWQVRMSKIHSIIDSLVGQDLEKIYQQTQVRRQANYQKFVNGEFDHKYCQTIQEYIANI